VTSAGTTRATGHRAANPTDAAERPRLSVCDTRHRSAT
jgi:hypothetical protein